MKPHPNLDKKSVVLFTHLAELIKFGRPVNQERMASDLSIPLPTLERRIRKLKRFGHLQIIKIGRHEYDYHLESYNEPIDGLETKDDGQGGIIGGLRGVNNNVTGCGRYKSYSKYLRFAASVSRRKSLCKQTVGRSVANSSSLLDKKVCSKEDGKAITLGDGNKNCMLYTNNIKNNLSYIKNNNTNSLSYNMNLKVEDEHVDAKHLQTGDDMEQIALTFQDRVGSICDVGQKKFKKRSNSPAVNSKHFWTLFQKLWKQHNMPGVPINWSTIEMRNIKRMIKEQGVETLEMVFEFCFNNWSRIHNKFPRTNIVPTAWSIYTFRRDLVPAALDPSLKLFKSAVNRDNSYADDYNEDSTIFIDKNGVEHEGF